MFIGPQYMLQQDVAEVPPVGTVITFPDGNAQHPSVSTRFNTDGTNTYQLVSLKSSDPLIAVFRMRRPLFYPQSELIHSRSFQHLTKSQLALVLARSPTS